MRRPSIESKRAIPLSWKGTKVGVVFRLAVSSIVVVAENGALVI